MWSIGTIDHPHTKETSGLNCPVYSIPLLFKQLEYSRLQNGVLLSEAPHLPLQRLVIFIVIHDLLVSAWALIGMTTSYYLVVFRLIELAWSLRHFSNNTSSRRLTLLQTDIINFGCSFYIPSYRVYGGIRREAGVSGERREYKFTIKINGSLVMAGAKR